MAECKNCGQENGELENKCSACGADLIDHDLESHMGMGERDDADGRRKLKAHGSHGDAPAKKTPYEGHQQNTSGQGAQNVEGMFEQMVKMMQGVKTEVTSIRTEIGDMKDETRKAMGDFKAEVKDDLAKVVTNVDNLTLETIGHQTQIKALKSQVDALTEDQAAAPRANPDLEKKVQEIKDIEKSMKSMLSQSAAAPLPGASAQDVTAVIGGLSGLSTLEEAEAWVRKQLGEWKLSAPLRICKKDVISRVLRLHASATMRP